MDWTTDGAAWAALTLSLTLVGGVWTWFAFRRRGVAAGLRGAAWTLLPAAAWLTGTLEVATEIGGSVADWATHLVLSPLVWAGIVLAGLSAVLFGVSGAMRARGLGAGSRTERRVLPATSARAGQGAAAEPVDPDPVDPELDEIEALLRKRGIT